MKTAQAILNVKGHDILSIPPSAMVFEAIQLMSDRGVGALLVMDDENLEGIVSERDYARKVILAGRGSKDTPVRDIMTRDIITVTPKHSTEDCLNIMTERRVRHLPVVEDGKVVGMLSIGDLVKAIIAEQQSLIAQLQQYISG